MGVINAFPGYEFIQHDEVTKKPRNVYKGEDVGFGGYVYAEPGMYVDVAILDVASMHPSSIINMNCFGNYTDKYKEILETRIAIKQGDIERAKRMLDGAFARYMDDPAMVKGLADALKTVLNSTYGLTSARFPNAFRDPRNVNNIVALRGGLFMIDLKLYLQQQGVKVVHIKTDSVKIPNASPWIIEKVMEFGSKYGYTFEHEDTYEKMCLVNDAVLIAFSKKKQKWSAVGAQFAEPYVFKSLFSKEPLVLRDYIQAFSVKTALYLDYNEGLDKSEHEYQFVGKAGAFCPVISGVGGGELVVKRGDDKYDSATGAKGFRWKEAEVVIEDKLDSEIDIGYFRRLTDKAVDTISEFGDFEWFVSDNASDSAPIGFDEEPPAYCKRGYDVSNNMINVPAGACKNCPYVDDCEDLPF